MAEKHLCCSELLNPPGCLCREHLFITIRYQDYSARLTFDFPRIIIEGGLGFGLTESQAIIIDIASDSETQVTMCIFWHHIGVLLLLYYTFSLTFSENHSVKERSNDCHPLCSGLSSILSTMKKIHNIQQFGYIQMIDWVTFRIP